MTISGFINASDKQKELVAALEELALLVGPQQETPTLRTVMKTVEEMDTKGEQQTTERFEEIDVTVGLGMTTEARFLLERAEKLRQGIFTLLVMGEFKHGKSTLLNAMLGAKVLVARNLPTTAVICVLVYGEKQEVAIYEDGQAEPRMVDWQTFIREFHLTEKDIETLNETGYIDRFAHIRYAQVECRHQFCEHGVRLIDSPGLKENISRTRMALQFCQESDAVIYLLLATQILSDDEKALIDTMLGPGRLENVFFVVNKCDAVDDEDELNELKRWVGTSLGHHFLTESGKFDQDFYDRRVFFISARKALQGRTEQPKDDRKIQESGLLLLERELEQFLTGEAKLKAILQSTASYLIVTVGSARENVVLSKKAYSRPLEMLEADQARLQSNFDELSGKKNDIETTILRFGKLVSRDLLNSLKMFVNEMEKTWEIDSKDLMLKDASLWNMTKSIVSEDSRQRLKELLEVQIKKYLEAKFDEWRQQAELVIKEEVDQMEKEVMEGLKEAADNLMQIKSIFAGEEIVSGFDPQAGKRGIPKSIHVFAGLWTLNPTMVYGSLMGQGEWKDFILRLVGDIAIWIGLNLLFPPGWFVLIGYALAQVILIRSTRTSFENRLRKEIGIALFKNLSDRLDSSPQKFLDPIEATFQVTATEHTKKLQSLMDQTRAEQAAIIAHKRKAGFSASQEHARLDAIATKLYEMLMPLYKDAFGKEITPEELDQEAAAKSDYTAKLQAKGR
jgi:GTPase Era involved in 16S rRNA processing